MNMNIVEKKFPHEWTPKNKEVISPKPIDPFTLLEPFFNNWTIGFNTPFELMRKLQKENPSSSYPPYNIIETGENTIEIQIAVAGLSKSDIAVTVEGERLIIKSKIYKDNDDRVIHRGIATRDFTQTFIISPDIVVQDAKMDNGLLTIMLEREIPDSQKPKVINIQ